MDHRSRNLWFIYLFIHKLICRFIHSQGRILNFLTKKNINFGPILCFAFILCWMNAHFLVESLLLCMFVSLYDIIKCEYKSEVEIRAHSFSVGHAELVRSVPSVHAKQNYIIRTCLYSFEKSASFCHDNVILRTIINWKMGWKK